MKKNVRVWKEFLFLQNANFYSRTDIFGG